MKGFSLRLFRRAVFSGLAVFMAGCASGHRTPAPTPTPGPGNAFVYTADIGSDSISGFANDSTGALTRVGPSFTTPVSGTPAGIAATPDNKFLYVSSFQNNIVNGFSISPATGNLTLLRCNTAPTTGGSPVKIAITPSGGFLYTSNLDGSVSGFSIHAATGCLNKVSTTAADSGARGLTIDRTGKFLYVVTGGGGINTFSINAGGTLTRLALSGFDSGSGTMMAVKASPTTDVLIATDGGSTNNFRTFIINTATGAITPIAVSFGGTATPFAIAYNAVTNPSSPAIYIANAGSNSILASSVAADGTIDFFSHSVEDPAGPMDLAVDPTGKFLYVANFVSGDVAAFIADINDNNFNSVFIAAATTGNGPVSIVVVEKP